MKILLVGGHQKTNFLTKSLKARHHIVTIINEDIEWCRYLSSLYDVIAVHGDGTKPFILEDAGTAEMDVVIALSNFDSTNLVVCQLAKKQFGVRTTIAVVNDPKKEKIFRRLGVSKCISAPQMITEVIESEATVDEIRSYLPLEEGNLVCFEAELSGQCRTIGQTLSEMNLPDHCVIGCIIRNAVPFVPKGDTRLEKGDRVIVISNQEVVDRITMCLTGKKHHA